jgi:hypothetical protein
VQFILSEQAVDQVSMNSIAILKKLPWLTFIILALVSPSLQSDEFDYDSLRKQMDHQVDQTTLKVGQNFTASYQLVKHKDKRFKRFAKREIFTEGSLSNGKKQARKSFITNYIQSALGPRVKKASFKVVQNGLQKEAQTLQKRMNLYKRGEINSQTLQNEARRSATLAAKRLTREAGEAAQREADRWKSQMMGQAPK